jgi:hypothetical protein
MGPSESTPFSARLDARLVARLKTRSARERVSASQLAERYIDEGLRSEEFPGIEFRNGPAGRRTSLKGAPDVWEVVRDVQAAREAGIADPLATVGAASELTEAQVRLAAAYYAEYPEEIDSRIAAERELTDRLLAAAS